MNTYLSGIYYNFALSGCCVIGLLAVTMGSSGALTARAQPPSTPADAAGEELSDWSRLVTGTTMMVAKIDTGRLAIPDIAEAFHDETIWVAVDIPYSPSQPVVRLYTKQPATGKLEELKNKLQVLNFGEPEREGGFFHYSLSISGDLDSAAKVADSILSHERPHLRAAINASGDAPLQCVIMPPDYLRDTVRDLLPVMPSKLGGGPSSVLTEGFLWAAVSIDPMASDAQLEIHSVSNDAANRLAAHIPVLTSHLLSLMPQANGVVPMIREIKPKVQGERVIVELSVRQVTGILQAAAQRGIHHAASLGMQKQLKEVAIAIHNFHDAHQSFPPHAKARDGQGKPRLSWRVHLLPYLDEAELYAKFRLDEPWNSDHNLPLVEKIPPPFASPSAAKGHTVLLAPVGEGTIFGGTEPVTFRKITDGTVNTLMVVVVTPERSVSWTAPEDYVFDPAKPDAGLARDPGGRILAVTADGAFHLLPGDLPAQTLLSLFQMNDGNPVRW